jgi:hypothetical protein
VLVSLPIVLLIHCELGKAWEGLLLLLLLLLGLQQFVYCVLHSLQQLPLIILLPGDTQHTQHTAHSMVTFKMIRCLG